MTKVVVVNGPNLGRLGVRQPDVYGKQDLETLRSLCTQWGEELGLDVEVRQSDDEAEMIGWMHQAADEKTTDCDESCGISPIIPMVWQMPCTW